MGSALSGCGSGSGDSTKQIVVVCVIEHRVRAKRLVERIVECVRAKPAAEGREVSDCAKGVGPLCAPPDRGIGT